jgi:hypothetical protein
MHELLFHKISYTWRNADFFNNIHPIEPFTFGQRNDRIGALKSGFRRRG